MIYSPTTAILLSLTLASLSTARMERSPAKHANMARHLLQRNSIAKRGSDSETIGNTLDTSVVARNPLAISKTVIIEQILQVVEAAKPFVHALSWINASHTPDIPAPEAHFGGVRLSVVASPVAKDSNGERRVGAILKILDNTAPVEENHHDDHHEDWETKQVSHQPQESNGHGLIGFTSSNCGPSDANDEFPNGSHDFLNCGISEWNKDGQWTPPAGVTLDNIASVTLDQAFEQNPDVWGACQPFRHLFNTIGWETGLPPVLLASIALQESGCREHTGTPGGEVGLMQITPEKCNGAPESGCFNPEFNIRTGARYLKGEIERAGGNILQALGQYNGWNRGMSFNSATAAAYGDCCKCQNNLDYLFQLLNFWMLGKNGYGKVHKYNNLAKCYE